MGVDGCSGEDGSIVASMKSDIIGGREDDLLGGEVCKGGHGD